MTEKQKKCDDRKVVLFFYEELDEVDRADVEAHLETCSYCRQIAGEMSRLRELIPAQTEGEIDSRILSSLRRSVLERITRPNSVQRRQWLPDGLLLRPGAVALPLAIIVVLFVTGFVLGRHSLPFSFEEDTISENMLGNGLNHLLLANRSVEVSNGVVDPVIAGIHRISFDPNTGFIEVQYSTHNEVVLSGQAGDLAVQYILEKALLDRENPAARLHAVETLEAIGAQKLRPDSSLVRALVVLLEEETNEGLRFMALRAIRAMYGGVQYSDLVKNTLLNILSNDQNQSIRMEALHALTQQTVGAQELPVYMQTILADSNSYIRYRASQILEEYGTAMPLENSN